MSTLVSGQLDRVGPGVQRLVANNPGYMTGPGTNTYLIGHESYVVIDPGPVDPAHVERIIDYTRGRIAAVLVTHTHGDHSPAAVALAERTSAPIFGRRPEGASHEHSPLPLTRELTDNEALSIDNVNVRVLHTPGHASNHLCFFLQDTGLLFTGDHLMQGSTVVIAPPDGHMGDYLRSLERLQREPVTSLAPGHGAVVDDAQGEIARVIAHRLKREAKVLERLRSVMSSTLNDLVPLVYDDVDSRLHGLARLSLLAHLIKLHEEQRVRLDGDQQTGHWHFVSPAQHS